MWLIFKNLGIGVKYLMAYKLKQSGDYRKRRNFSMIKNSLAISDLLEVQTESYKWFATEGIKEVFETFSPIESFSGSLSLEFGEYEFGTPRYSIKECKDRQITYAAPLKVQTRLFNNETGEVKEQEIFLGDMPLMTDAGTFIINGAERVIVSQLVRSPSIYFKREIDKNGRRIVSGEIIPNKGTWLEYETDSNDVFSVRIDRTRKLPVTVLLRAMGSIFSAGGTTFAENTWEQYLNFKDDKLTEVILGMRSQDKSKINRILLAVAKALRQRGFIIANYESDEDKLVFDGPSSETFILNGVAGKSVSFRAYDQAEVEKLMNDKAISCRLVISIR